MSRDLLVAFEREAGDLLAAIHRRDPDACGRVKWEHPRFRGMSFAEMASVDPTSLTDDDARMMVARHHALASWTDLTVFVSAVEQEPEVSRFERAADAVVTGEAEVLRELLLADPGLVNARSRRTHHATLLHYVAANGVEESRQRTPPNAVAIATLLLDAGADPNARADMYDERASTMQMLVSSAHPAQAGVEAEIAETLLSYGATLDTPGTREPSAVRMALAFGYLDTARRLATRLPAIDDLIIAAGLGLDGDTRRLLRDAGPPERHRARTRGGGQAPARGGRRSEPVQSGGLSLACHAVAPGRAGESPGRGGY